MKVLSLRKISLVIGIALGIAVMWTAASPANLNASTIIGGEDGTGCPCTGTTAGFSCSDYMSGCSGTITVCDVDSGGSGTCDNTGSNSCSGSSCDGYGDATCT